jgi:hypothetical protein
VGVNSPTNPTQLQVNVRDTSNADHSTAIAGLGIGDVIRVTGPSGQMLVTVTGAVTSDMGSRTIPCSFSGAPPFGTNEVIQVTFGYSEPEGNVLTVVAGQPAWRPAAGGDLESLADVTAPPTTPVGKVLGTTAVGEWGPVDFPEPPSGLPPLTAGNPVTLGGQWTHTRINGVNAGRGETGRICLYDDAAFQISTHDAAGVDRSAEIESLMVKGAVVTCTYGTTSEPLTLTGPIERRKDGLSDADFYFASVTGGQSTDPADDQAVVVTVVAPPPADGSILTLAGGAPTWAEPAGGGATADHNIDEVVYAMTANAGIWPWGGNTWGPGSYVMHNDRLWYTAETAPASEVPGVSPLWRDVTLSESPPEVAVGPTEPTDPSVLLWVKTPPEA